ncbi:carbohydrate kinase [Alsobacter metallidurans]|uniref:Carbohydrate kinase n=1 Tax=Alsobacter metallidurans TaxID=340221 RepID=A0A917I3V8_9HYPH|nr:FGGY-family carbohydrate kinase [Alsobacter metallidurans]GGH09896.1 carbohydrate kinase [Alsobacter metallidurans]
MTSAHHTTFAVDLGGTSLRAALVGSDGGVVAMAGRPQPFGSAGSAEADPATWWTLLADAADELESVAQAAFEAAAAVAITSVTRTQVFVDARGRALGPALTWADARSAADADTLRARLPQDHVETALVNAFHPLARLAWLRRTAPDRAAAVARVLEPKDWLNARLTGRMASDPIASARLAACRQPGPGGGSLFEAANIADPTPDLLRPASVVGAVRRGLPGALGRLAGARVVMLSHDTWASVLGLGALHHGGAYNLSGTTEVVGVFSKGPAQAPGLMSVDWGGLTHLGGPGQNGADALRWALDLLGFADEATGPALDRLLAGERFAQPLLFLPYLQGERTPYWDPMLRGAFVGLDRRHTATDCAWAVLEGVAFLNRIVFERAEAALGFRPAEIRFGGGGAASPAWAQVKADVCGVPVVTAAHAEPGLLGGAIAAAAAADGETLEAAQERLAAPAAVYRPAPARAARLDASYALFRQAEAALTPISHALAKLGPPQ